MNTVNFVQSARAVRTASSYGLTGPMIVMPSTIQLTVPASFEIFYIIRTAPYTTDSSTVTTKVG